MNTPETSPLELTLTRLFNAPRSLVYQAWTQPQYLSNWCCPHGFSITDLRGDLRPGGEWHTDMVAPDGEKYPVGGTYLEIIPDELLVMTHIWREDDGTPEHETLLSVRFADEDGKTRVTLHQTKLKSIESRDGHIGGWSQCLERLSALLGEEHAPLVVERLFSAPLPLVWKAITDNECFKHWYFDLPEFRAEVGFEFSFDACKRSEGGEKFTHLCRVTKVVPEKELAYTWRYEGHEGDSLVTFELKPEGDKTRLTLTHTGLETFPASTHFARGNFLEGWTHLIGSSLREFVETPQG